MNVQENVDQAKEDNVCAVLLSERDGHTNAYTASKDTNYHFECNWEASGGPFLCCMQAKRSRRRKA